MKHRGAGATGSRSAVTDWNEPGDLGNATMEALTTARVADLDALCALLGAAGLPHEDLTPAHLRDFLLLREGEAVVGAVGLERLGADALLRSLVVRPDQRGRGLGGRLVDAAEARARNEGVTRLWLLTETAAPFFAARGYAPAERDRAPEAIRATAEFAALCPASAACLAKRLDGEGPRG